MTDALLLGLSIVALLVSIVALLAARRGALRAEAEARRVGLVKGKRGRWYDPNDPSF